MQKKKQILASLLVLGMTFSSTPSFAASMREFVDSPSLEDKNWEGLNYAVEKGFLVGYKNKLEPNKKLTRAELAVVLTRVYDSAEGDISRFSDLVKDAWYYKALAKAYHQGFIKGKASDKMAPHDLLTTEEAYTILVRLSKLDGDKVQNLSFSSLSPWAKESTSILLSQNIISKEELVGEKPKENITRGDFASLLYKVLKASKSGASNDGTNRIKLPPIISGGGGSGSSAPSVPASGGNNAQNGGSSGASQPTTPVFDLAKVKSATVKTQPMKLSYVEGDNLDLTGLVVVLTDENNKTKEVELADFSANGIVVAPENSSELTLEQNNTKVRVTKGSASVETNALSVGEKAFNPNAVKSVEVKRQPTKLSYVEGDNLDLTGLVVVLKDENNKTKEVALTDFSANGIAVEPVNNTALDLAKNGTKVRVTKGGASVETNALSVTEKAFNPNAVREVSVKRQPTKLSYVEGDNLDLTGLVVVLTDENNKTKEVALTDFEAYGISVAPENGSELAFSQNGQKITIQKGSLSVETEALEVSQKPSADMRKTYQSSAEIVTTTSEKFPAFKTKYGDFIDEFGYVNEQEINQDYLLNVEVTIENGRVVSVTPTSLDITKDDEKYLKKTKKYTNKLVGLDKAGVEAIKTWRESDSDDVADVVTGATITNNAIKHEVLAALTRYQNEGASNGGGTSNQPDEVYYTLSYDKNGGEGNVPEEARVREGASVIVSFEPAPTKANHRFLIGKTKAEVQGIDTRSGATATANIAKQLILQGFAKREADGASSAGNQNGGSTTTPSDSSSPTPKNGFEKTVTMSERNEEADERDYTVTVRVTLDEAKKIKTLSLESTGAREHDVEYFNQVKGSFETYLIGWSEEQLRNSNVSVFRKKYQNNVAEHLKRVILEAFSV